MLTEEQKLFRKMGIGGSDANIIMSGDDQKIINLWQEKRGERESDDLSDVLMVQMGVWTEPFNRIWFQRNTNRIVTNDGEQRICLDYPFMLCTLDGMTDGGKTVWEAKHVNGFTKANEVVAKYAPQLHHNMIVTGTKMATLSVFFGNHAWDSFDVPFDETYAEELIEAEKNFWECVQNGIEPVVVAGKYAGPINRTVDFEGNNHWAALANDFIMNMDAAGRFDRAKDGLKKMIEPDVMQAKGHGIIAKRSSSGAITIKKG
jgi:predicted phage-related endonuclease